MRCRLHQERRNVLSEEKRIYVIVAETVQPEDAWRNAAGLRTLVSNVTQPAGRIAAQVGHVVSHMRVERALEWGEGFDPITTIVLAARNSAELKNAVKWLAQANIDIQMFWDKNEQAYGVGKQQAPVHVMTAICTHPIDPAKTKGVIDHLPLWAA